MESITYYTRDGQEWGVLALTLDQLRTVNAALISDSSGMDFDMARAINIEVRRGIDRLTVRDRPPYQLHGPEWADDGL